MSTKSDSKVKLISAHKKSLTELSINDDNHINYNTDSNINDNKQKSNPMKKRKRKSEAAIHINTSRLFPSHINGHKKNNNNISNGNSTQKPKRIYRHSHSQMNNQVLNKMYIVYILRKCALLI